MKAKFWLLSCLLVPAAVLAAIELPPPALLVKIGAQSEPLPVSKIQVEARITGYLAETRMTLTFHNPNDRQLEGELYFPLPEGSTLSGYGLDINGVLVDGVIVEKDKGRQVFEKIVRQGIDPGLAEWTKGNNFKTRVYPIPAKGTRTVMVRYVSDLVHKQGGAAYTLPLQFRGTVPQFDLRVEVVKPSAEPKVTHSVVPGLAFTTWTDGFTATASAKDVALDGDLVIDLPDTERAAVQLEKSPKGPVYFAVHDFPVDPRPEAQRDARKAPQKVVVLWDASGSRAGKARELDLAVLKSYFAGWPETNVQVDLVLFRNRAEAAQSFTVTGGKADALLAALQSVAYDGGTQMGALTPAAGTTPPDFYFLFSDGLSNFGKADPTGFGAPVYAFAGDASADHAFLRSLAQRTGGQSFNLNRMEPAAVAANLGRPAFLFLGATLNGKPVADAYPEAGQPVQGRFSLMGVLTEDEAKLSLSYGVLGQALVTREISLSKAQAPAGKLLQTAWAQKKLDTLQSDPEKNRDAILETGKQFGLVTPETSLIVLDSLEQYIEHQIVPPETMPELYEQYGEIVEQRKTALHADQSSKLDHIVQLWQRRVGWWNTQFETSTKTAWKDKNEQGEGSGEEEEAHGSDDLLTAPSATAPMRERQAEPEAAPSMDEAGGAPMESEARGDVAREMPADAVMPAPRPIEAAKQKSAEDEEPTTEEPAIVLKAWSPDTPYLKALKKAPSDNLFAEYMKQRQQYNTSPAFYLDCADFFLGKKQNELALQILSNIAEMELENAALLRILGHRLAQLEHLDLSVQTFEQVLRLRPEEPQSFRDLALILARQEQYGRALELLEKVVMNRWDRFDEIEVIALMEFNNLLPKAKAKGQPTGNLDARLIQLLDVDVRIVITWDADLTDIDLWVIEPTGEKCYYSNALTAIGGQFSRDFTQGYGPEEYAIRKALNGVYKIQANFYGSQAQTLSGAVTLQADIFTNYGRPNEKRQSITLRLVKQQDTIDVGEIEF